MTREMFLQAAGAFYDMLTSGATSSQSGGSAGTGDGRPPKYDTRIPAGNGMVIYASECSLKELRYQKGRSDEPPSDPKYTDANAKRSKALSYFIAYRQENPTECWVGERDRVTVTAKPPADKPQKYPKDAAPEPEGPPPNYDFDSGEDDIPFVWNVTAEPEERWTRNRMRVR